jgi:hypothetical protein
MTRYPDDTDVYDETVIKCRTFFMGFPSIITNFIVFLWSIVLERSQSTEIVTDYSYYWAELNTVKRWQKKREAMKAWKV